MEKIIVISELIRGELRSRTEAKKIYAKVLSLDSKSISIDFSNVCFMSRSFADELCNILDLLRSKEVKVRLKNKCDSIDLLI